MMNDHHKKQPSFAQVVFDLPVPHAFTYAIPEALSDKLQKGVRVLVPFGPRKLTGFVVDFTDVADTSFQIKPISKVLDEEVVLPDDVIKLCEWIAIYYLCGPGEALNAAVPGGLSVESRVSVKLKAAAKSVDLARYRDRAPVQYELLNILLQRPNMTMRALQKKLGSNNLLPSLRRLEEEGLLELRRDLHGAAGREKSIKYLRLTTMPDSPQPQIRASKQRAVLEQLVKRGGTGVYREIVREAQAGSSAVQRLVEKGFVEIHERRVERDYYGDVIVPPAPRLILNVEQEAAVSRIREALQQGHPEKFLLHGVTGSGKTQVYIEAIRAALALHRGAIILVPEISLTPQAVRRYRSEFQTQVAVLHSRMSPGERYDAWRRIRDGRSRVVIGPRSAVFAPVQNLGLIVVDEEHDTSYKQSDNAPRYHARDVAVVRAQICKASVVLGSATPSMESYHNVRLGKYALLEMKRRIDDIPLPAVELVHLGREKKARTADPGIVLSAKLVEKIGERLAQKQQVIILQNRRGYATTVRCRECGQVQTCPNCNISLTYHLHGRQMRCHYCDLRQRAPEICPHCESTEIQFRGIGTQRVEEVFAALFPQARMARMDMDTTRGRMAHDKILQRFAKQEIDILIGTQMVAKGHDFPGVTLVGVISADTGLYLPDFRASERTFQLLTQVAGRAGRKHEQGEVVIQTYSPEHTCLRCAQKHAFREFYYYEIHDRRELNYPPFSRLALLQFRHASEEKARHAASAMREIIEGLQPDFDILGPAPAPLARLQNAYRFQIILKSHSQNDPAAAQMRRTLALAASRFREQRGNKQVRFTIDVDPVVIL